MNETTAKNTEQQMPWILYGTAWKKERTCQLVEMAIDEGFIGIDTANQPKHYQEISVGEALKKLANRGIQRSKFYLQTKFTPLGGQDHRVPYDPSANLRDQVFQSFESSLDHLHTDYLDSLLLHGPYDNSVWGNEDNEVWAALEELQTKGGVSRIGISNVNLVQLRQLFTSASIPPAIVQNRCFANRGWDREIRAFCEEKGIIYQGFSLLTANPHIVQSEAAARIAERVHATPEQVVIRLATQMGITPLTGTTNREHMQQDLTTHRFSLSPEEIQELM